MSATLPPPPFGSHQNPAVAQSISEPPLGAQLGAIVLKLGRIIGWVLTTLAGLMFVAALFDKPQAATGPGFFQQETTRSDVNSARIGFLVVTVICFAIVVGFWWGLNKLRARYETKFAPLWHAAIDLLDAL